MRSRHAPPADAAEIEAGPSHDQHKYYRSQVLPAMADRMGYESHAECHMDLKRGFLGLDAHTRPPSMAKMSKEEASRFLSWVIRNGDEIGAAIPTAERKR